jgi:hypothetical protein
VRWGFRKQIAQRLELPPAARVLEVMIGAGKMVPYVVRRLARSNRVQEGRSSLTQPATSEIDALAFVKSSRLTPRCVIVALARDSFALSPGLPPFRRI